MADALLGVPCRRPFRTLRLRGMTRPCAVVAACLVAPICLHPTATRAASGDATEALENGFGDRYLLSTPQLSDPLIPLRHAVPAAGHISVRAAVVTVADPLETHLGRAFDIQISALIRAFHVRGYVLDAFAFTWKPERAAETTQGKRIPENGTRDFDKQQRDLPSVVVLRRDAWRGQALHEPGAEYIVIFLVGESPIFGVHPGAFTRAAKCAAALNRDDGSATSDDEPASFGEPCDSVLERSTEAPARRRFTLNVVGPSFSGSMQSLALALSSMASRDYDLSIRVTSPSATVKSNEHLRQWTKRLSPSGASERLTITYASLAASLDLQLAALCRQLPGREITILAEESSFGRGVSDLVQPGVPSAASQACGTNGIRVTQFSPNVSSIRAEHSALDRDLEQSWRGLLKSRRRLLELDLTGVDESTDMPPAYQRTLSSRSDELMLHSIFDNLRVWVRPKAVAIVATDVRDRLFLLNEVRKALPTALPVLFEMDFLTTHPDYRTISRGSLVIPSGDPLVCLDGMGAVVTDCASAPEGRREYFPFPADYAANMFRSTLALIDENWPTVETAPNRAPVIRVTTLAGFQALERPGADPRSKRGTRRSTLLAADSRLALEVPAYAVFMLWGIGGAALAASLWRRGRKHLVMMSPLRNLNPWRGVEEAAFSREPERGARIRGEHGASAGAAVPAADVRGAEAPRLPHWALVATTGTLAVVAAVQICRLVFAAPGPRSRSGDSFVWTWDLAHGRDAAALACLFLLYLCLAVVGWWRLSLWRARCRQLLDQIAGDGAFGTRPLSGDCGLYEAAAIAVICALPVALALQRGIPTAVDSPWPFMATSAALLVIGGLFIAACWVELRRWLGLAQLLAPAMKGVANAPGRAGAAKAESAAGGWPSPVLLKQLPQSPFNLQLRACDIAALCADEDALWAAQTRSLVEEQWPFGGAGTRALERWQARLVAEMRYAAVAVRSCAWCVILAPTTVLLSQSVYPPVSERLLTGACVALIVCGFALITYVVVSAERHPLLGPMFTHHGDRLTAGGVIGALWPKFLAASIILVPVVAPDLVDWVHGLLKSVNSLR